MENMLKIIGLFIMNIITVLEEIVTEYVNKDYVPKKINVIDNITEVIEYIYYESGNLGFRDKFPKAFNIDIECG